MQKKPTKANIRALETIITKMEVLQSNVPREYGHKLGEAKSELIRLRREWETR